MGCAAMITLSRNEVEQLCQKAARGAELSWGMAEEVGFSIGWLESNGIAGASELVALMEIGAGASWGLRGPSVGHGAWTASSPQPLCPFLCGAAISDFAQRSETDCNKAPLHLAQMYHPILLLPFVAGLTVGRGINLSMTCDGAAIAEVDETGAVAWIADAFPQMGSVTLSVVPKRDTKAKLRHKMQPMTREIYAALTAFALKTTVPASEASRAGAGAGGSDND